ncbi:hypothetical protein PINS_up007629 [Pythium insidiosum]|nr:hypothetical protein PINS_up007629 [Pythium insidiosum]
MNLGAEWLTGWIHRNASASATASAVQSHDQLKEVTSLLHNALAVCDDDLLPFQQAWESVFAELPAHRLVVSTDWLRTSTDSAAAPEEEGDATVSDVAPYLAELLRVSASEAPLTLQELSDADKFQDAKDIQRDEVVVNGRLLAGAMGYDRVVQELETTLRETLATELETATVRSEQVQQTLPLVAQRLLHVSDPRPR